MYTRPYNEDGMEIRIPENYVGTAFSEPTQAESEYQESSIGTDEYTESSITKNESDRGFLSGIFGKGLFDFLPRGISSILPKSLGVEEILLIGLGIFLLFSGSHDTMTSLILLGLIFIK